MADGVRDLIYRKTMCCLIPTMSISTYRVSRIMRIIWKIEKMV